MYRSLLFAIITMSAASFAVAQTPEAPKSQPQTFAFSLDGGGGYLGVQTTEVTRENFGKYGLRDVRGVAVGKVMENSPAAVAGIKEGDVIVRFNGEEVTSARKLTRLVGEVDPDHQARVTVLRNGSEHEITATIGKRPAPQMENGNFSFGFPEGLNLEKLKELPQLKDIPDLKTLPPGEFKEFNLPNGKGYVLRSGTGNRQIGVGVYALTKQLGQKYGVDSGVMINEVREGSPAARAGLKAGDIVVEANGKAVSSEMDLIRAINEKKDGDVTLTIMRDSSRRSISVTPEAGKDIPFTFGDGDESGALRMLPRLRQAMPVAPAMRAIPMPAAPLRALLGGRTII